MSASGEIAANTFNAVSILLAARNSVHTWWTGILGCLLFGGVFYAARLYADVTLQVFFIVTSGLGRWNWIRRPRDREVLPVRRTRLGWLTLLGLAALLVASGYGFLLHTLTNAAAPFFDSAILTFSVLGQFLLMDRRIENWWCWLVVNTVAVPLYASRGLHLTSVLYAAFWINAVVALFRWRNLLRDSNETV